MTDLQILEQCRQRHEQVRSSPQQFRLRLGLFPEAAARHDKLFQGGYVAWAATVKANDALSHPGQIDLPGCAVYSLDPYFDDQAPELVNIADGVFALYKKVPSDPSLKRFAAIVSDDTPGNSSQIVPLALTRGREVRYETLWFQRDRLPTACITHRVVPVVIDPRDPFQIMLLPLACWAPFLVERWKATEANRVRTPLPVPTMTAEEFARNPLSLSPAAAAQIRMVIQQQRLRNAVLRVGYERGAYSMDITENRPDPTRDFLSSSQGINIAVARQSSGGLAGIIIDFLSSAPRKGFTFSKRPPT